MPDDCFDSARVIYLLNKQYYMEFKNDMFICKGGTSILFFYEVYLILCENSKTNIDPIHFIVNEELADPNNTIRVYNILDDSISRVLSSNDIHTFIKTCLEIYEMSPVPYADKVSIIAYSIFGP